MNIIKNQNITIPNPETRDFLADAYYPETDKKLPLIVFVHGYKGYKDWGAWNLMAEKFAEAGFFFVKFNFSHNGTTIADPNNFADLEAFGNNNYSKEVSDLDAVIEFFIKNSNVDNQKIILIGHSRGGGISIVKTFEDERINGLITLASVDTLERFPKNDAFEKWKEAGVYYVLNGRTKQEMPHYYQFYEDFEQNVHRFDVERAAEMAKAHFLIIHGTNDESVSVKNAEHLHILNPNSELFLIENANHTFGAKEPWDENNLPEDLNKVVEKSIEFINDKIVNE
ncbi:MULTISPECIES: S9 family peptidase [Chryseobacterium]|uniref:Dipeptidyl aminopeptidase/acylaminoacyl peptidase n=1 Tax=Chryseobacterium geocarposphaerae TaxID=1416776 RepID=A0ABU1LGV8_9FLAO|nr:MULTISPECIES: alpha/beta fold hydrolase [Chryseobacterium]MDR6405973.1 dipeptidyl aminopeptidase/acylaminoacyl peptidase [Chryseobacterium geocarposphaerae]MDR6699582.1 dipeptidyl aminopeptidase/acylaminoacyl peptidase [Chryseobacterium ginsenosidimutans]